MKRVAVAILAMLLLAGCPEALRAAGEVPSDQLPMYGNIEKSQSLRQADERFIRESGAAFGSRERASDAFAQQAWQLYQHDDLTGAVRLFNKAWLLNPHSPQPYWGFGVVLHDQGKAHEALAMLNRASELDPLNPRLMADLARTVAFRAAVAGSITERETYFTRACELFEKGTALEPGNGHSYGLWALALYERGRYAKAWEKVHKAQELPAVIPEKFLRMQHAKMPEPK